MISSPKSDSGLPPSPQEPAACPRKLASLCSASALALALGASGALAQTSQPAQPGSENKEDETIVMSEMVVSGMRASLLSALEIKSESPLFVDSIVAQDIGKFPDNTVADALQRVAGIQVSRSAGEANTIVIRGLPNLETTVNGYEVFTGTGRGVALQDIPAEMVAGVDVYKTVGPDKIEGGVAGLIDIRLRRPLDFKEGFTGGLNLRGLYADQRDKYSYSGSALASNHWKNDLGDFGLLVDVSYARRYYMDQVVDNYIHAGNNGETYDIATDSSGTKGFFADNLGWQIIPGDRTRTGVSLGLQWRTKSGLELYSDNLFTGYTNDHSVNFFIGIPSWGPTSITDVELYPAGYDGYVNDGNKDGTPDRFVRSLNAHNSVTLTSTQAFHDTTRTYQGAFGAKWNLDRLKLNGEFSYSVSTYNTRGVILDTGVITPSLSVTYNDNDAPTVKHTGVDYADVKNFFLTQFYDQWSRAHSDFYAGKLDGTYSLDTPFFKSLQMGVRASERKVNYHSDFTGGTFVWNAAAASSIPGLGKVTDAGNFLSADQFSIQRFWAPDASWLLQEANADKLRTIFGRQTGMPASEPGNTFIDTEKTYAAYAMVDYHFDLGGLPLDGVVGGRFVRTRQDLNGYQHPFYFDPVTGTTAQGPGYEKTTNAKSRNDFLPTVNGRLKLADDLFLRGSVTKTVTRPNFGDLNPALSLTASTKTVPGSGSGGNPDLDPIKSTNYDLSLEYYFSKSSLASVQGFYRSLDGYVQRYASYETVSGAQYLVNRPRNTNNGYLQGVEVGYQQFFDFLPDAFKGFGIQTNYTMIEGESENPITNLKQNIAQVSKHNYNVVLMYERAKFSTRLAYNWRGKYIESFGQGGVQPSTVWVQSRGQLDFSASYNVTKNLTVSLDATNLTGSKYHDNFGDIPMFSRDVRNYDTTYELGLRYRF